MVPFMNEIIKENPSMVQCGICKDPSKCGHRKHIGKVIGSAFTNINPNNVNLIHDTPLKNIEKHHLSVLEKDKRRMDDDYRKLGCCECVRKRHEILLRIRRG